MLMVKNHDPYCHQFLSDEEIYETQGWEWQILL